MCRTLKGLAIIISPIIAYRVQCKITHVAYRINAVRMAEIIVTAMNISPKARPANENPIFDQMLKVSLGQASIAGDLNARRTYWESCTSARGARHSRSP